ncbi:MAG: DUF3793 family protein [Endomicrobiaceae bacterium]
MQTAWKRTYETITCLEVLSHISRFEGKYFLSAWLKYFLSPTTVSSKPATLLSLSKIYGLQDLWNLYGKECCKELKINFHHLHHCKNATCVLFYKEDILAGWINKKENKVLLAEYGYHGSSLEESLCLLEERFKRGCPDEVGIFLGIPAVEVRAFCSNIRPPIKKTGYWQVFVDLKTSLKKFKDYDAAFKKIGEELMQQTVPLLTNVN